VKKRIELGLDVTNTASRQVLSVKGSGTPLEMTVDAVAVPSGCETWKVRMSSTKTFWVSTIVDPDAYLEDRSLLEGSRVSTSLSSSRCEPPRVVEIGVGGLGVGSSTVGADPSEKLAVRSTVMVTFVS
jgi:hypothetical protein